MDDQLSPACPATGGSAKSEGLDFDLLMLKSQVPIQRRLLQVVKNHRRYVHLEEDVARGSELVPIPWRNDFAASPAAQEEVKGSRGESSRSSDGAEGDAKKIPVGPPPTWIYMKSNVPHDAAEVEWALNYLVENECKRCEGNCITDPVNRMCCGCASEDNFQGQFAYTAQGLLTDAFLEVAIRENQYPRHINHYCTEDRARCDYPDPDDGQGCPGHLNRTFIKECWIKCGCDMSCSNRVVQRGIQRRMELYFYQGKGWGVRALEDIPRGAFVMEYTGEIMTNDELDERNKRREHRGLHSTFAVDLAACYASERKVDDKKALNLDATYAGNLARFINHCCGTANLVDVPVEYDCANRNYYHVAYFSCRDIKAGEELTWDYKIEFQDPDVDPFSFRCECGSPVCRFPSGMRGVVGETGAQQGAQKGKASAGRGRGRPPKERGDKRARVCTEVFESV